MRDEQHLVEREEHRDLDRDRQAAGDRIDLLLLVQLHHRLLLLHLVVAVALADHGHFRLHRLHLRHRGVGLVGEREEQQLDQHRDDQDGDAEIADEMEEEVDGEEHRLGDEVEPAPVDQQIEMVEVERLIVAAADREREIDADHRDFLGAGEQPGVGSRRSRRARWSAARADNRSDRSSGRRPRRRRSGRAPWRRCQATARRPNICR